jgi:hypothetical protein
MGMEVSGRKRVAGDSFKKESPATNVLFFLGRRVKKAPTLNFRIA